jgi:electron transfer flavoprotein alpha subunit
MSADAYVVVEHLRGQVADISYVMLAAARCLAEGSGGKTTAVLLGNNVRGLAGTLAADEVLCIENASLAEFTSDAYVEALEALVTERHPRAVLFGSTSMGADLAGLLSGRAQLPLVSSCRELTADGRFVSQICGGKIMAEGVLPEPTVVITMIPGAYKVEQGQSASPPPLIGVDVPLTSTPRIRFLQYVEPQAADVDIAKESVLVSVGRGIQNKDNIELAENLASGLGGVVTGSRPVVDQGWLATSRLVGKSGKHVKPKLYLAIGISGAPEHVEAITDSGTIIAINMDPAAPIFSLAKYGVEMDMFELVEVLTAKVTDAKAS